MARQTAVVIKNFSIRLKEARIAAGYSQAVDLARFLGIEKTRYGHFERGRSTPDLALLWDIADATAESIDYLITGKNSRRQS